MHHEHKTVDDDHDSQKDTFESVMARANEQARLAKARGHNRVS